MDSTPDLPSEPEPQQPDGPPAPPPTPPAPPSSGGYVTSPPAAPMPSGSGPGFGAGVGVGTAIGCASMLIALVLFLGLVHLGGFSIVTLALPLILGAILLIWPRTRGIGVGVLIISAAAWIIVIGPCLSMLHGV